MMKVYITLRTWLDVLQILAGINLLKDIVDKF